MCLRTTPVARPGQVARPPSRRDAATTPTARGSHAAAGKQGDDDVDQRRGDLGGPFIVCEHGTQLGLREPLGMA
jgi:hypothetical protein